MPRTLPAPSRSPRRLTLAASAVTSVLAAGVFLAPPAQAAWTTGARVDGAKVQVCKVPLGGGDVRVRVRLDNRANDVVYKGMLHRYSGPNITRTVSVRAAGKISGTKSMVVKAGSEMGTGISGPVGGLGSFVGYARNLARC
ncbi:hypothetical protein GHK92_06330 [Nocardioides sp. dk4132]|uniref:hypothetical protein n=1 Tax=unclassified Nocardioides TaxID=2615069 RepID=UPI001294D5C6|nr:MULTISPECIES: hypothetical protein [unclassified Nocardioides]MQW75483.1 hypothetical protein [Nocardioides sp. dk4132]QGA08401.1 hypothetical protein GFH29_14075 [Nocardioides sp. dk884]